MKYLAIDTLVKFKFYLTWYESRDEYEVEILNLTLICVVKKFALVLV